MLYRGTGRGGRSGGSCDVALARDVAHSNSTLSHLALGGAGLLVELAHMALLELPALFATVHTAGLLQRGGPGCGSVCVCARACVRACVYVRECV